jgi:hypothetical protein
MMLIGELRSEAIEAMRGISSAGEKDEWFSRPSPIEHLKLDTLLDPARTVRFQIAQ